MGRLGQQPILRRRGDAVLVLAEETCGQEQCAHLTPFVNKTMLARYVDGCCNIFSDPYTQPSYGGLRTSGKDLIMTTRDPDYGNVCCTEYGKDREECSTAEKRAFCWTEPHPNDH